MTAARGLLVLAMIAALMGAPSDASAAANMLVSAHASPSSGTVGTEFTLAVTYEGRSDAIAVRASAAGRVLDMGLISGTPGAGTWQVRTTLPAGSWPVRFSAIVDRGNPPTLAGPTLTVSRPDTASPTIEATEPEDEEPNDPSGAPDQPAGAVGSPATPDAPAAPVEEGVTSEEHDPVPASTPPPVTPRGSVDAVMTPVVAVGEEDVDDAPNEQDLPAVTAPSSRPAPVADAETSPEPDPGSAVEDGDLLAMVLLIGLIGVGGVALGGTAFLLATRRREPQPDGPPTSMAAVRPRTEDPGGRDVNGAPDRQARRRARLQMADDPIMAALGIDDDIAGRRARRRADSAAHDPGGER